MLIVLLMAFVAALAAAGVWLYEVWHAVPDCNADFDCGEV